MAYWWVNQKQTWKAEIPGRYMWSPKQNRNGARNQSYDNMCRVKPGDLVFSYINGQIAYLGLALAGATEQSKPKEFGAAGSYWSDDGWLVPVLWMKLNNPARPKEFLDQLGPTLPKKYSPFLASGKGQQNIYLGEVPEDMAAVLFSEIGPQAQAIVKQLSQEAAVAPIRLQTLAVADQAEQLVSEKVEREVLNDTTIDETVRKSVINARRGQGRFRSNLERFEMRCRVTNVTDPRLLKASHIKPWARCSNNHERLDGNNGLLLAPHIDHLFDKGYITFEDDGRVVVSQALDLEQLGRLGLENWQSLNVGKFRPEQMPYLDYHRNEVFIDGRDTKGYQGIDVAPASSTAA